MFIPFASAKDISDRFLDLLHRLKIDPPIGSGLESELLSVVQLLEVAKDPGFVQGLHNQEQVLRSAAGILDLAAKVLTVEPLPEFADKFVPHLRLIEKAKVRVASLGQNAANEYDDDTARKIAELYIGCLTAHLGTDVELDHPEKSKGDNPDVMFTLEDDQGRLKRWTLAIKTIGEGRSGQTIFERILDGRKQIDAPSCKADHGIVVINAKNAINHSALWNARFADLGSALKALKGELNRLIAEASKDRPQQEWDALFTGKMVRPIVFMAQTIVQLPTSAGPLPTPLGMMVADAALGQMDGDGAFIAHQLNVFMQTIRQGIPGRQGVFPH
ncbi:hypothetical protein ABH973_005934 [Bradyrhizobium ottawaense]|uniref:hypothetical protein n=1 Tax=Bradyrhizobium ottawaense TaxID=931866 RepID=UPI0035175D54